MESVNDLQVTIQTINQAPIDSPEFRQLEEEARRLTIRNAFMMNDILSKGNGQNANKDEAANEDGHLLNTFQISKYFNLTPKTIRGMVRRGDIRGIKIPPGSIRGEWRFKRNDVERSLLFTSSLKPKAKKVKVPDIW